MSGFGETHPHICWQWHSPMPEPTTGLGDFGEPTCRRRATETVRTEPEAVRMCWQHARKYRAAAAA